MTDTRTANLTVLVTAREALLAADPSPANTRALNKIEAELDLYPWREVKAMIDSLKAERASQPSHAA